MVEFASTVRGVDKEIVPLLAVSDVRLIGTLRVVAVGVSDSAASVLCETSAAHPRLIGTVGIPAATHTALLCDVIVHDVSMLGRLVMR